ncbi:hypothetical protein AYK21_02510 [Thermoplasmatales archaeon SG8-52-2]|nr:MAG: hypothetical protein AYK21_02510 [Thermoplasmatales archaeon SG8-52-2]
MYKCEKCGKVGDSTEIKSCPENILDYAKKPICKQCYLELKKIEENKLVHDKSIEKILKTRLINGKTLGENKDWLILAIQAIGLFLFPFLIGILFDEFLNIEYNFETMNSILIFIKFLLSIIIVVIFIKEANKWVDNTVIQTIIFSVFLIPYIFTMYYFIGLLLPQLFYWGVQNFEWKKSGFNIFESWKSLVILGLGLFIIGIYLYFLDFYFKSGGRGFLNLSIGDQGLILFLSGLIFTIIGIIFKIKIYNKYS